MDQTKRIEEVIEEAWLNIDVDETKLINPFSIDADIPFETKLTWLMSQPEYFSFVAKELLNIEILPLQALMLEEMWNRKFPMLIASRGFGKSFILSLYSILRALLMPGRRIVVVGAAFRQSKVLFEYMSTMWRNAALLRDIVGTTGGPRSQVDMCRLTIGESTITCLPLGDGSKIRGQRANDIIADEFASIPRDIFENVVAGFAAVSASPVENVKLEAAKKKAAELGTDFTVEEKKTTKTNQIILSGTAFYDFNHFADYWKRYKSIIESKGEDKKLREVFKGEVPSDFNWKDYSVIRIPFELLPHGFMDAGQVARSKATVHSGIYQMEYGACFTTDSQGFFKRSLIESCVVSPNNVIDLRSGQVDFQPMIRGNPQAKYIYGVDPASEVDNFSIVVLEVHEDHRRVVYCWTTNRQQHKEELKARLADEDDFYSYCARKIRDLMRTFPCEHIAMDAQGGGIAVMEALHDRDKIRENEVAIWPIIEEGKEKDTDGNPGSHILEMCQFAKYDWLAEANHGLRKDFEDKALLFPYFDAATIGLAISDDKLRGRKYDTLEDCVMEIEELKNELSMIVVTQTNSGRERWDTPEVKLPGGRKNRIRKDRYSSLIMANMAARSKQRAPSPVNYETYGGFANTESKSDSGPEYMGPAWFTEGMKDVY